ncbi:MAG: hypothetical protein ACI9PP_000896 [Halobacteriales archaeon]|jgi:hypothetical protein
MVSNALPYALGSIVLAGVGLALVAAPPGWNAYPVIAGIGFLAGSGILLGGAYRARRAAGRGRPLSDERTDHIEALSVRSTFQVAFPVAALLYGTLALTNATASGEIVAATMASILGGLRVGYRHWYRRKF